MNDQYSTTDKFDDAHDGFRKIVDKCKKKKLNQSIPNSTISHATYLLHALLGVAADDKAGIRLVSGKFDRRVYDRLVDDLQKCVDAELSIDVVVTDDVDVGEDGVNEFHERLKSHKKTTFHAPIEGYVGAELPHMFVVDGTSFRYEPNPKTHEALANFHNPDIAKLLNNAFDQMIGRSVATRVPS